MTEEEVSQALFSTASVASDVTVLTWHAVDGKSYFTSSIKFRLPSGERAEPDLVLLVSDDALWIIEIKGLHSAALADEEKLVDLIEQIGGDELLEQVHRRTRTRVRGRVRLAVAFGVNDQPNGRACQPGVLHIDWPKVAPAVAEAGLAAALIAIAANRP